MFLYQEFLASLTESPGIYQMRDAHDKILYIGKARNLKKRLSSYFQKTLHSQRLVSLVSQIHHIEVIVTRNENEALLLENQLIKQYSPKYNILLRDDKSYPYLVLSHHAYPRIFSKRGEQLKRQGEWFGPYPSAVAVRETIKFIQKTFRLRTCRDNFFKNRVRPCLLYQLKKCTAPCTGKISEEDYSEEVKHARLLLRGRNEEVISHLVERMTKASQSLNYESAAMIRDQITYLRHIQTHQIVTKEKGNYDVFAVVFYHGISAVELLSIRAGNISESRIFYTENNHYTLSAVEVLSAFIPQYYMDENNAFLRPLTVIINEQLPDQKFLEDALKLKITYTQQGEKFKWIKMAEKTGEEALKTRFLSRAHYLGRLASLQKLLKLSILPSRMVCFDISHSSGEATVASCVVFDQTGPVKKSYRFYNIENITKNDDYAAMYQVLEKYFKKQITMPDIVFIDGGKGQLRQAEKVCEQLNIPDIMLVAVAKGPTRKAGFEQLFVSGNPLPLKISPESEALHLIQQIRDEAHRFAISSHRKKRAKNRFSSILETIPGIGQKRRTELLQQLGGLQEIKRASVEQLEKVKGINRALAEKIYQALHDL